ncbi:AAA family ATPase [Actinoplanes derwentensis]|uniref:AAA family ATPase n=1 Tax=Actinoplanes derwentensis TaxID=113562 RepID=UPI0018D4B3DF|nr:ATP-binding protein [Actinoplanes derwentensis]
MRAVIERSFVVGESVDLWRTNRVDTAGGSELVDRARALAMLRLADLGIQDVRVIDEEVKLFGKLASNVPTLQLLHRTAEGSVAFDLEKESQGTQTWLSLIGPVLTALRQGTLMVFDELEASLHPTLSAELLRIFADPTLNPRGAQLVFTSHDTSLLNHLNRDEVWLTEKRPDGSTRLGALSDFAGERVRKSQNLESAYLHGRFGALPQLDQTELLRALGLIG